MENQKSRFLDRLLGRIHNNKSLLDLENAIRNYEKETRECYSEDFGDMDSDEFVKMMVCDACFIVELFRLNEKVTMVRTKIYFTFD